MTEVQVAVVAKVGLLVLAMSHLLHQVKATTAVLVALICLVGAAVLVLPELLAVVLEQVVTVEMALLQAFRAAQ
jgi:hypothetical protein